MGVNEPDQAHGERIAFAAVLLFRKVRFENGAKIGALLELLTIPSPVKAK